MQLVVGSSLENVTQQMLIAENLGLIIFYFQAVELKTLTNET